jgi:diadenosine tetraphosphatase ApaH/serine/threonine PP2A family protein phosphatase
VRILVISDIHANLEALEACLLAAPAHDRVFNLGDIVGYGANPNEVTERSRQLGAVFVRGNHDKACSGGSLDGFNPIAGLAALWTRERLKPEHLEFLREMPQGPIEPLEGLQCVHGSPRDEDEYLLIASAAYEQLVQARAPLTFFGHTHVQCGYLYQPGKKSGRQVVPVYGSKRGQDSVKLELEEGTTYLINPGSIGQPRDGDPRAAFALYDTDERSVTFHRVPYDIAAAQEKIFAAGLPERLAIRLEEGR